MKKYAKITIRCSSGPVTGPEYRWTRGAAARVAVSVMAKRVNVSRVNIRWS